MLISACTMFEQDKKAYRTVEVVERRQDRWRRRRVGDRGFRTSEDGFRCDLSYGTSRAVRIEE